MFTIGLIHKRKADPIEGIAQRRSHGKKVSIVSDFLSRDYIPIISRSKIARPPSLAPGARKTRPKRTFKARLTRPKSWCSERLRSPTKPKS
jgi:hypothetical protein